MICRKEIALTTKMAAALLFVLSCFNITAQLCYEHPTTQVGLQTPCANVLRQQQLSAEKQKVTQSQQQKLLSNVLYTNNQTNIYLNIAK